MTTKHIPLSVLDLAPISSGSTAAAALANTVDLARLADRLGYHRYWLAEHHLSPGLASSAPAVVIGQVAAATQRIRVGSGATLLGFQTPLSVVEHFSTLAAFFPGRIDLGLGRGSGSPVRDANGTGESDRARHVGGLLIPARPTPRPLVAHRREARDRLLTLPGALARDFGSIVDDIFSLLGGEAHPEVGGNGNDYGDVQDDDELILRASPGYGSQLDVWVLGSSAGESARVAAERGLPFAANYHVSPASVLEAVDAYRRDFRASKAYPRPHVMVSADVLIADTTEAARARARPYAAWVQSIRQGGGAIPYPSEAEAARIEIDPTLVTDRVSTQFVGTVDEVVPALRTLCRVTEADELVVTTIAHHHADRLRSYALLGEAWVQHADLRSALPA